MTSTVGTSTDPVMTNAATVDPNAAVTDCTPRRILSRSRDPVIDGNTATVTRYTTLMAGVLG